MDKVLIIGASNIDYIGKSKNKLIENDSNIGRIKVSFGGVGRNICENLARYGIKTTFITSIGNDYLGKELAMQLKKLNVKIISPKTNEKTSSYMAIHDIDGDMAYAISDMDIVNTINPSFLEENLPFKNDYKYIILDGNINDNAITYLLGNYHNRFVVDGISTTKVLKFKNHLDKLFLLKCNIYEAQALAGFKTEGDELIQKLFELGLNQVVVTNGAKDIYYGINNKVESINVEKIDKIVNATGAGDSMLAGIVVGLLKDESLVKAIDIGKKFSQITLQSEDAVSKDINKDI